VQYGLNYDVLYKVIHCESSWNPNAVGDNGLAFSVAQFHRPTFNYFCKGEYENPYHQIDCMAYMFSIGKQYHWTCYKMLIN
jgi:hypothetical protein